MSDRRAFPRIAGSALPWLTAFSTARSPILNLLDISAGGALIETPTRWKPGERELFVLRGDTSVKVAGWVLRAEVTRLTPSVSYTSAIRFAAPVTLSTLGLEPPLSPERGLHTHASRELQEDFVRRVRGLLGVLAIRVSSSFVSHVGAESVYFEVPNSEHGDGRFLQIFFAHGTAPSIEQFVQLRQLAVLASGLPDLDIS